MRTPNDNEDTSEKINKTYLFVPGIRRFPKRNLSLYEWISRTHQSSYTHSKRCVHILQQILHIFLPFKYLKLLSPAAMQFSSLFVINSSSWP